MCYQLRLVPYYFFYTTSLYSLNFKKILFVVFLSIGHVLVFSKFFFYFHNDLSLFWFTLKFYFHNIVYHQMKMLQNFLYLEDTIHVWEIELSNYQIPVEEDKNEIFWKLFQIILSE